MQIDALSQTLTPEERDHIDERKFVEAKFAARDLQGMLVPADEAARVKAARGQVAQQQQELQTRGIEAEIRKTLSDAFKNIAQGQKNTANSQETSVKTALELAQAGEPDGQQAEGSGTGKKAAG